MRRRIAATRASLAATAGAAIAVAAGAGIPTGLVDVNSLLRMTDFFDLNPLW